MRIIIDSFDKVSEIAAEYIIKKIITFQGTPGKPYYVIGILPVSYDSTFDRELCCKRL